MSVYVGETNAVQLPTTVAWDPRTGWQITQRWRGSQVTIDAIETNYRSIGCRTNKFTDDDGSYWTVEVTSGATELQPPDVPLSDQWSLDGNDLEKSIWEFPEIASQFETLILNPQNGEENLKMINVLRNMCESYAKGEVTYNDVNGQSQTLSLEAIKTVSDGLGIPWLTMSKIVASLALHTDTFLVSQWVLRRTTVIAANSTIKPALRNINKVFTTQQLRDIEGVPGTIRFDLPEGEWLKRTPTFEQTAADKWTIKQEWWHADKWNEFLYERAS